MFKTIKECQLELVAHSRGVRRPLGPGGEVMCFVTESNMDYMPCSAARVSFGNEDKTGENVAKDKKLMKYLADHKHMSPFEHQSATFLVEVPLFIRSQIMRHRTFSYNEISRRYTDENLEFWVPDTWRQQANNNRQASEGEVVGQYQPGQKMTAATMIIPSIDLYGKTKTARQHVVGIAPSYTDGVLDARYLYESMVECGICREQARAVLPQSLLTKFYMTGSLRSWAHFLELRLDEHAQYEVRVVAERIRDKLKELWPSSMEALGL